MSKSKNLSHSEIDRLRKQMIDTQEAPATDSMIVVHKQINKAHQRITENVQLRIPTDVLEFVENHIYEKNDRITVLYHLLELGAEVMKGKLADGDVIVRYGPEVRK